MHIQPNREAIKACVHVCVRFLSGPPFFRAEL